MSEFGEIIVIFIVVLCFAVWGFYIDTSSWGDDDGNDGMWQ
ncbi:MAG: hypothetical protein ABUJ92_00085 [Desulfobacterales bacterium]